MGLGRLLIYSPGTESSGHISIRTVEASLSRTRMNPAIALAPLEITGKPLLKDHPLLDLIHVATYKPTGTHLRVEAVLC